MRSRTGLWFECRIRHEKVMEDGMSRQVSELYAIEALSYSEAESRIIEELSGFISGQYEVSDIRKASYKEVFFDEGDNCSDRYYRVRLQFITIDEKTAKEKATAVTYLVNAVSFDGACRNLKSVLEGTMMDYRVCGIAETKLLDVFEYDNTKGEKKDAEEG